MRDVAEGGAATSQSDHQREAAPTDAGARDVLASLRRVLANGPVDPQAVAAAIAAAPGTQRAVFSMLHQTFGNSYVQSVVNAMSSPQAAPAGLGFEGGALDGPRVPQSRLPLTDEGTVKAQADRATAERLLKAKSFDTSGQARQAMELLLEIPDAQRGRIIDQLDDQAFENLLVWVPDADRERFAGLLQGSRRPERKLRLWAEFHKSRADNEVAKQKGDIGQDVPVHKTVDEEGNEVEAYDPNEVEQIRDSWTPAQRTNRARHDRRAAAAASTKDEVDGELRLLLAKAKAGKLTLADVDELRERKDLEYAIELENNVNLTAQQHPRKDGRRVLWEKRELEDVQTTLARLPHVRDTESVPEFKRVEIGHFMDQTGGRHEGTHIEITDQAASSAGAYGHAGEQREGVSPEFRKQHGDTISRMEYVVAHEVGHDVAMKHDDKLDALSRAAGWQKVSREHLVEDGVSDGALENLEKRRDRPNGAGKRISGGAYTYTPIPKSDQFWAVPKTSMPTVEKPGTPEEPAHDTWNYATVNPQEHFAETYARAVHVPMQLHQELVERPTQEANTANKNLRDAEARLEATRRQTEAPDRDARIQDLTREIVSLRKLADEANLVKMRRGEQFRVMRETVFQTHKAVAVTASRLQAQGVDPARLQSFHERAARLSTPEQIAVLEKEIAR